MANYFSNCRLVQSNSRCEIYSFGIVDDFYKILEYNMTSEMQLDFDYNVITIQSNDNDRHVFNININDSDLFSNSDSINCENLIRSEMKDKLLVNMGMISKERIIVKENKTIEEKVAPKNHQQNNDIFDDFENPTSQFSANRKRLSDQQLNHHSPPKKSIPNNNYDSEDELGSRSRTQPKVPRSFPTKKKIDVLNELQNGKSIEYVSRKFSISEKMIRDFQQSESEIRQQFRESNVESDFNHHPVTVAAEKTPVKKILPEKQIPKPTPKTVNLKANINNNNIIPKVTEKSPENAKLVLSFDFQSHNGNGKLIFSDFQKRLDFNPPSISIHLSKDNPDIPKSTVTIPKKSNLNQSLRKSMADMKQNSNLIPRSEPIKLCPEPQSNKSRNLKPSNSNSVKKPVPESRILQESRAELNHQPKITRPEIVKPTEPEIKISKHYPTDPVVKTELKPVLKKKSSTNKYEPPKNQSPFRYLIIDPSTLDFKPADVVDSEIKSTNIDSEEFIDEVHASYHRFTECVKIYEKYNLKREELKTRASTTRTEKEISELYKEFYRLVEEEKLPFFIKLEKEVTSLHSKLCKVANLMGIKLT